METKLKELKEKGQKFIFIVEGDNKIRTITSKLNIIDSTVLLSHLFYLFTEEESKFILTVLCHLWGTKITDEEKLGILATFFNGLENRKENGKENGNKRNQLG